LRGARKGKGKEGKKREGRGRRDWEGREGGNERGEEGSEGEESELVPHLSERGCAVLRPCLPPDVASGLSSQ